MRLGCWNFLIVQAHSKVTDDFEHFDRAKWKILGVLEEFKMAVEPEGTKFNILINATCMNNAQIRETKLGLQLQQLEY